MKQIKLVQGANYSDFVDKFNEACQHLDFVDSYEIISPTVAYIFYDIEKPKPKYVCADCENYEWGKGCAFCDGVIRPMHPSCEYFNVEVVTDEKHS